MTAADVGKPCLKCRGNVGFGPCLCHLDDMSNEARERMQVDIRKVLEQAR